MAVFISMNKTTTVTSYYTTQFQYKLIEHLTLWELCGYYTAQHLYIFQALRWGF